MTFTITSFNVKGLNSPNKCYSLWRDVHKMCSDILCLQETHFCANKSPPFNHRAFLIYTWPTNLKKMRSGNRHQGHCSFPTSGCNCGCPRSIYHTNLPNQQCLYTIANVYVPNSKQLSFIQENPKKEVGSSYLMRGLQLSSRYLHGHLCFLCMKVTFFFPAVLY